MHTTARPGGGCQYETVRRLGYMSGPILGFILPNRSCKHMASCGASQSIIFTCQTALHSCNHFPALIKLRCQVSSNPTPNCQANFANLGSWPGLPGVQALLETISTAGMLGFSVQLSGVSSLPPSNFHPFTYFSCFTRIPPLLCSFASPPSAGTLTHSH